MSAPEVSPFRLGLAVLAAGDAAAAVPLLERAVALGDGGAFAGLNLGLALANAGRLAEAVEPLARAAEALPHIAAPRVRLGQIAGLRGDAAGAAENFLAALACDPGDVVALAGLAAVEEAAGRLGAAAALLDRACAVDAAEPELVAWMARLLLARGEPARAAVAAARVLADRPTHMSAARVLAGALAAQGGAERALREIAARAAEEPFVAAWPLAAAVLRARCGEVGAAVAELRAAELLAPSDAGVQAELGHALAAAGRAEEAESALRAAVAANGSDVALRNRLATVLWKAHRLDEALAVLDAALADFGPEPALVENRALLLNLMGDQDGALAAADRAVEATRGHRDALVTRLSVLPYHPSATATELRRAAEAAAARLGVPAPVRRVGAADPDRPLRVGLLSGNLCCHPVGWLTVAGIEALPEHDFTILAYSLRAREDWISARYRARCAAWRELGAAPDEAVAEAVAADGLDILLDLGGLGEGGRPGVLHRRPAPVQVKWVGSQSSTTGMPSVDWMLTDRWETPEGFERFYTERLLRLPDGYVCYAPAPYAPAVSALPASATGRVTFGCFNNLAKVTAPVLRAWAQVLRALPDARLVLRTHALGSASVRNALVGRMRAAGVPSERVSLYGGVSHSELLAAYREVDVALDPFPYTGGLTVCEALWMGVPVVALTGEGFAARHALSHLSNVGLPDWACATPEAYVARAVAAANDLGGLAALRASLRERVRLSPLCDAPRFGRGLGAALRAAWQEHCGLLTKTA